DGGDTIAIDGDAAIPSNRFEAHSFDAERLIAANRRLVVCPHSRRMIAPDEDIEVFLRAHRKALFARLIVEGEFVVTAAASDTLGSNAALRAVIGEIERERMGSIVQTADHRRPIDVAAEKGDQHLGPHAGYELRSKPAAAPRLGDAQPTGALVI